MAQDSKERRYEVPLDGKMITGDDPAKIGPNFQSLINLRYSNKHPKAIGGMTKVNTTVISANYPRVRNGIHYRKAQPVESHLLVEAYDTSIATCVIFQNTNSMPDGGDFVSTPIFTPTEGDYVGRWSYAPNGDVAYCNGADVCEWGGDEMEIAGFINYLADPLSASTSNAFTVVALTDILTTAALVAQTQSVVTVTTTDTLPAPLLVETAYYIRRISDTDYTLHASAAEALYNVNIIDITNTGAGVHTIIYDDIASITGSKLYDYTERLRNTATDTANTAVLMKDTDNKGYFYIGSIRPLAGFKLYIGTANTSNSTMAVHYWSGSGWSAVSTLVDNTSASSKSLKVTGTVTFDSTETVAKTKYIHGIYVYWYRVVISLLTTGTSLTYATVNAPFQTVKDIWSGENYQIDSFKASGLYGFPEATVQVRENKFDIADGGTYFDAGGMKPPDYIVLGFNERMTGVSISLYSGAVNVNGPLNLTVKYWDGAAWTTVGDLDDGTSPSGTTFTQTGTVTWNAISPELEIRRNFENGPSLYYYQLTWDGQFSHDVYIFWVTGIPAQKVLNSYKFPLLSNNRLFLCCNTKWKKNSVICSAVDTSSVFNGEDSIELFFGDESELTGGAWIYSQFGSSLFNVTLFFKKNETWALVGTGPEDWVKYRVSGVIGCVDPETIRVVDLGTENTQGLNRNVAIWRAANSIVISDGRTPIDISNDIKDVFDKRNVNSLSIHNDVPSSAFWDSNNKEYHFLFATGNSTKIDRELVFSFTKQAWFEINRGADPPET